MASDQGTVDHLCAQAGLGARLSSRKMFGEYALYLDGKVVALVCDNQLFLKPTPESRTVLDAPHEHPPYPGAKPHFLLDAEIEDRLLLQRLLLLTAQALPAPKPKAASPGPSRKTSPKTSRKRPP
jgi:TfoX/Sxy family transcriptional regulator of competence genes